MNYIFSNSITKLKSNGSWYLYNWLNNEYAVISEMDHPLYVELEKGSDDVIKIDTLNKEDLEFLQEKEFIVTSNARYLTKVKSVIDETYNLKNLSLILLPAGQACNFSCGYCYENHTDKLKMSKIHKEAILKFIKSRNREDVNIEYFGGEPLMNKNFILSLNKELFDLSEQGLFNFNSSMTTNGYALNSKLFIELFNLNLKSYQITIDGLKADHNISRPLVNGKGTFEKIIENLKEISSLPKIYDFRIDLRVNFSKTFSDKIKRNEFLQFINTLFYNDKRFFIRFRPISDFSSMNSYTNNYNSYCSKHTASEIKELFEIEAQEIGLGLADLPMFANTGGFACYAGKPNNFIITPDLKVRKCTVALDNPINEVGTISPVGELLLNDNWDKWIISSRNLEAEQCSECSFLIRCLGSACPLKNIEKNKIVCPNVNEDMGHNIKLIINHLENIEE